MGDGNDGAAGRRLWTRRERRAGDAGHTAAAHDERASVSARGHSLTEIRVLTLWGCLQVLTGKKKNELIQLVQQVQENEGNPMYFQMLQQYAAEAGQELSPEEQMQVSRNYY